VSKRGEKFQAQINIDGKQQYLGTFDTRKKAAAARALNCVFVCLSFFFFFSFFFFSVFASIVTNKQTLEEADEWEEDDGGGGYKRKMSSFGDVITLYLIGPSVYSSIV